MTEGYGEQIRAIVEPSRADIVRAKSLIMEHVSNGEPHDANELVLQLPQSEGLAVPYGNDNRLDITDPHQAQLVINDSNPILRHMRLQTAGMEGLVELAAEGLLIPTYRDSSRTAALIQHPSIQLRVQGSGSNYQVTQRVSLVLEAYVLPHRLRSKPPWPFDADLFIESLGEIDLEPRAERTLREALEAYRRGLYLGSATLLGAVSEAVWYWAGESLRDKSPKLAQALESDRTVEVQRLVAEVLRKVKDLPKGLPDELVATATLLRDLRNYGVHPRAIEDQSLERHFTEETCGLLILNMRFYLARLVRSVGLAANGREQD